MLPIEHFFNQTVPDGLMKEFVNSYQQELELGFVTSQTKYNYAWCLCRSTDPKKWTESISIFEEVATKEDGGLRKESLFHIMYTLVKLERLPEACEYCDKIIELYSKDYQAKHVREFLIKKINKKTNEGNSSVTWVLVGAGALLALCGVIVTKSMIRV